MKKKLILGLSLLCAFGLASCNNEAPSTEEQSSNTEEATQTIYEPTTQTSVEPSTQTSVEPTQSSTETSGGNQTVPTETQTTNPNGETIGYFETPVITEAPKNKVNFERKHFDDNLLKNGPLTESCLPSLGSPRVLVVPINLDDSKKDQKYLSDLEIAFNGTQEETGWYSVHDYYYESSYHKLDLQFDVMNDWFTPAHEASYYVDYYDDVNDEYGNDVLLREALAYYDSTLDYNNYNYDSGDDCIDAVWLIYNSDVIYELPDNPTDDEEAAADFYWAYTSWYYGEEKYDGLYGYYYAFAGVDFMYEDDTMYDNSNILVDTHTFIHETGHLLGLDDYYDYTYDEESGEPYGGLYLADMMDYDLGDHNAATKLLLGWIDPIIATGSNATANYNLNVYTTTGDVIIVADHTLTSVYDEYFIIEFYKNVGLNENDQPISDDYEYDIEAVGIRILHVDAHQNIVDGEVELADDFSGFKYNNSYSNKKFIEHLRADYGTDMEDYLWPESLYTEGMTFGTDCWSNHKYHSGSDLNFTVTVNSMTDTACNITINLD